MSFTGAIANLWLLLIRNLLHDIYFEICELMFIIKGEILYILADHEIKY